MCNTACSGCRSRSLGQGWVSTVGFLVSLASQHPWEPPDLCKVGGSPILGVVEAGHLPCRVVRFPPPVGPGPVLPVRPVCHVPSVGGAVEAFFAGRDLAAATCRTYRQALTPLVEAVGADRPVTDLCPDQVAAVFGEVEDGTFRLVETRRCRLDAGDPFVVCPPRGVGVVPEGGAAGRRSPAVSLDPWAERFCQRLVPGFARNGGVEDLVPHPPRLSPVALAFSHLVTHGCSQACNGCFAGCNYRWENRGGRRST